MLELHNLHHINRGTVVNIDLDGPIFDWRKKANEVLISGDYGVNNVRELNKSDDRVAITKRIYEDHSNFFNELETTAKSFIYISYLVNRLARSGIAIRYLSAIGDYPNLLVCHHHKEMSLRRAGLMHGELVTVPHSSDKIKYCRPGDILIDDFDVTIETWNERGGMGIPWEPYEGEDLSALAKFIEGTIIPVILDKGADKVLGQICTLDELAVGTKVVSAGDLAGSNAHVMEVIGGGKAKYLNQEYKDIINWPDPRSLFVIVGLPQRDILDPIKVSLNANTPCNISGSLAN